MESIVNRSEAFSLSNTAISELCTNDVIHTLHAPRFAPDDYVGASLPVTLIHGEDIRYPDKPDVLVLTNYRIIVNLCQVTAKKQYYDVSHNT